jgi:PIN domain nuclease of toxin-antitoxin system
VLLLDTHALVWLVLDSPRLGKLARRRAARGAHVSAITFWELEMLAEAGRLRLGTTIAEARDVVLRTNVTEVPIDGVIAMTAARLGMHGDPGDRFIVATALTHGATLMTADEKIRSMKSLRTVDPTR